MTYNFFTSDTLRHAVALTFGASNHPSPPNSRPPAVPSGFAPGYQCVIMPAAEK